MKVTVYSLFTDYDIELFKAGKHFKLYEKFGAHPLTIKKKKGCYFAVWAPNAESVSVISERSAWEGSRARLNPRWDESGIWEGFIEGHNTEDLYQYHIETKDGRYLKKADPFAFHSESPPAKASVIWSLDYDWGDSKWTKKRGTQDALKSPMSIYEMHLGSWMKHIDGSKYLYSDLCESLVDYLVQMGYTHVEMMPVMEFPYDPSWGYQITGFFTPTSRFGSPQEFMVLIDSLHQANISVILDWVPSHFPEDEHGLAEFDGTRIYEYPDPKMGYHPDWKSLIFDYGRPEVRSFLISTAMFWVDKYHIDALRVDAVASILYLDYSRNDGEWIANKDGGNVNLEAVSFLQEFNTAIYSEFDGVHTIAEESTSYPAVSRPVHDGGLGFGFKWMMGWMNDTLEFFQMDPIYRKYHLDKITFGIYYAHSENFVLPLSHDEVVHGKASLLGKMPGDEWQKFANLRLLLSYMYAHPGGKLCFMGAEIGQYDEWNFETELSWPLLDYPAHRGVQRCVSTLNHLYKSEAAFYERSFNPEGFEWISFEDVSNTVVCFLRKGDEQKNDIVVICNFTPNSHKEYKVGVPKKGRWKVIYNSDEKPLWGSDFVMKKSYLSVNEPWNGRNQCLLLDVPPLAVAYLKMQE